MKNILKIREAASTPEVQQLFARDMAASVDRCIADLKGIKGVLIKKSYQVVKNVRKGYIEHMIMVMSNDFINAFEPLHEAQRASMTLPAEHVTPFRDYLAKHSQEAYDAFISVADKYAESRKDALVGKSYAMFRPQLSAYFQLAIPYLADVVDAHTVIDV